MLTVDNVSVQYGRIPALREVSLNVNEGEIVSLIGANGAGKTTLLNTIAGIISPRGGNIEWGGEKLLGLPPHKIVNAGIGYVPEGRQLFGAMRVIDNLTLGTYVDCSRKWYKLLGPLVRHMRDSSVQRNLERVYELFPILADRASQHAGSLSGGEQQMLAIARALMSSPSMLLLDEPSVGLAPTLVKTIWSLLTQLREDGLTILLVEQDAGALRIANRGYVMEQGRIVLEGESRDLLGDEKVLRAYLGRAQAD
jgi:branched-chain amino acid transport system ATP-binding protein